MKTIVIDIETFWASDYSLSLKDYTTQSYIRDERFKVQGMGVKIGNGKSVWVPARHVEAVLRKLDLEHNAMVGHNLHFDGSILAWHYGIYPKLYIDTLALSRALIGQHLQSHTLANVAEFCCGLKKFPGFLQETKGVRDLPPEIEARLAQYCVGQQEGIYAGDTELTYAVLKRLLPHMPKDELKIQDWSIRIFTDPKVLLDTDMLVEYNAQIVAEKKQVLSNAGLETRDLLMSAERYAGALRSLGVDPPTKLNAAGKVTYAFAKTDSEHKALLEHDSSEVQALVAARLECKSTIEETRSAKYIQASQYGPWPIHLNASGAKNTHRFSGGAGAGGNPQNWKRGGTIRDSIYAPEGKVFIVPDLSQIEARITLWLGAHMPNANMELEALENLRKGEDIYSWFGSHIYDIQINKHTHKHERQVSKSGVLGLGFGMGKDRFIEYCKQMGVRDMTPELAERIKNLYRSMFSGVKQLWQVCDKQLLASLLEKWECVVPNEDFPIASAGFDIWGSPAINLPGGLHVKYPGLTKGESGWQYKDGNMTVKLFGGKVTENCLGSETEVLTSAGWKRIIDVTPEDTLWDGGAWVSHAGVACRGEQDTIDFGGVAITPDHRVDINGQWTEAQTTCVDEATASYQRHYRLP